MAPEIRIELILTESKSAVLPLHYSGINILQIFKEQVRLYTMEQSCQEFFAICCLVATHNKKPLVLSYLRVCGVVI